MPAENQENFANLPDIMTMEDVWTYLGIGKHMAYKMARQDPKFPALRFGRSIRVPKKLLVEWMEERCREQQAEAAEAVKTLDAAPPEE